MALIDELKERWESTLHQAHAAEVHSLELYARAEDLARAIAALEAPAQSHGELRTVPPATEEESGGQILQTIATLNALDNTDRVSEDFTLLDPAVLRDEPDGVEAEPEGYAPVVRIEAEQSAGEAINAFVEKLVADVSVSADTVAMQTYMDGDKVVAREISAREFYASPTDASVVDAEPVLDATELAQVTIDKVPPTAEVIKDKDGRAKFALFGGQTHEVVEPSNTEADFWARVLHPRKREEA